MLLRLKIKHVSNDTPNTSCIFTKKLEAPPIKAFAVGFHSQNSLQALFSWLQNVQNSTKARLHSALSNWGFRNDRAQMIYV